MPPPAKVTFRIDAIPKERNKVMYNVSCEEVGRTGKPSKLFTGVMQALTKRSKQGDLWQTLVFASSIHFLHGTDF